METFTEKHLHSLPNSLLLYAFVFVLFWCSTMSLSANCLELVLDQVICNCRVVMVLSIQSSCSGHQWGLCTLDIRPPSQRMGLRIKEPHLVVPVPVQSLPRPHPRNELCLYPSESDQAHACRLMAVLSVLLHTPVITLPPFLVSET